MNFASNNISIFPFSKNRVVTSESQGVTTTSTTDVDRRFYEANVVKLIRQLMDVDGFIISYDSDNDILEFNLAGYFIKIDSFVTSLLESFSAGNDVYASLNILNGEVDGQDEDNRFTGVTFSNAAPASSDVVLLLGKLVDNGNTVFVPNSDSFMKFNANSLKITKIDGKPLNS